VLLAKHAVLKSQRKDCLAPNHDNVPAWSHTSTFGLLFQWASSITIQLRVLV